MKGPHVHEDLIVGLRAITLLRGPYFHEDMVIGLRLITNEVASMSMRTW